MGKFKLSLGNADETVQSLSQVKQEKAILETIAQEILLEKFPSSDFIEGAMAQLPSKSTDADFNSFIVHDSTHIDLIFGDVSLKGLEATILATRIKECIPKKNIYTTTQVLPSLQSIVNSIEELSYDLLRSQGAYLSLLYGRFDLEKMEFSFIDRGFTRTLILNEKGEIFFLTSNFLPLGIEMRSDATEEKIPIHPGEKWMFYSDGLIKIRNNQQEPFGFTRLAKLVQELKNDKIQSMQASILTTVDHFREDQELEGEILLLILRILSPTGERKIIPLPQELPLQAPRILDESKSCENNFQELQSIQSELKTALEKDPRIKKESDDLFQIQLIAHEILMTILQTGARELNCRVEQLPLGVKMIFSYLGPLIEFQEDSTFNLFVIQKNVQDVRYGKDIKGKTYIEVTKLFRGA
jgi:serine phosphatase RsbU (regulator of sigma subunit)